MKFYKTTFEKLWEEKQSNELYEKTSESIRKLRIMADEYLVNLAINKKPLDEENADEKKLKELANQVGLGERELSDIRNGIEDKDGNPETDDKDIRGS